MPDGYLMTNRVFIYLLNIYNFVDTFLNQPELICLHIVKWFQVLLCNSNSVTSVICLNTFKWIYVGFLSE